MNRWVRTVLTVSPVLLMNFLIGWNEGGAGLGLLLVAWGLLLVLAFETSFPEAHA